MKAERVQQQAPAIVADQRRSYGDPTELFEQVAVRWSQLLGSQITATLVDLCLMDLKLARLAGDPQHRDSLIDVAGYAACLAEVGS
jgi:hypothetical protein